MFARVEFWIWGLQAFQVGSSEMYQWYLCGTTGVINKIYALSLTVLLLMDWIDKFDLKSGRTTR